MRRIALAAIGVVVLGAGLGACTAITGTDDDVLAVGTVEFVEIEGGCWTIRTDDRRFQPTNLAPAFREDGLRVAFRGEVRDDLAGFCPGEFIELRSIERAD